MRDHIFGDFCPKDPEGPHPIDRGVPLGMAEPLHLDNVPLQTSCV